MSAILSSQHWGGVEPVVRKHFGLELKKRKKVFDKIFKVSKGTEAVRHSMEWGGPGQLVRKMEGGNVTSMTIRQGPNKTLNYEVFAGAITLSFELARDHKVREVKRAASSLGRSMALTPEYQAALFLDRAFNSSFVVCADGNELCATDHLIVGTNAATGSNAGTAALSETALDDVMVALSTMPGPDGMIAALEMESIVVPAALAPAATRLSMTEKNVGSANNDVNIHKGIKVIVNPYLGSTTRWFALTDSTEGLFWEWDIESQFMEDQDTNTFSKTFIGFYRARHGVDDWRHVYGQNAS